MRMNAEDLHSLVASLRALRGESEWDAIADELIKPYGEQNSKKTAKYVPFWA